jgi:hypothetical protein
MLTGPTFVAGKSGTGRWAGIESEEAAISSRDHRGPAMGQRKRCTSCGRPFYAERANYARCDDCRGARSSSDMVQAQRAVTAIGAVTSLAVPHAMPIFGVINAVGALFEDGDPRARRRRRR